MLLPKTDAPENPFDLKPITVLSRIYRQWSRYRAVAISELTKTIPSTIVGGTPQMSSLLLSGYFQDLLEDGDNLRTLCGLTADIVKCYNTIPRYPLALFMMKLGWPLAIVKALAVASMLTLSVALYHYVTNASPSTGIFTFADNWSFIMENFQHAEEVVSKVEQFCRVLRLRLSIPKSWTWALSPIVAKQLQGLVMQGEPLPNVTSVKDLGVDTT